MYSTYIFKGNRNYVLFIARLSYPDRKFLFLCSKCFVNENFANAFPNSLLEYAFKLLNTLYLHISLKGSFNKSDRTLNLNNTIYLEL